MKDYGFVILRHVNNELTNKYWIKCYNSIRVYYPEYPIVIIDDNSNYKFIGETIMPYKTNIIRSEYPKHGEFLPYYYYLKNKWFKNAIIIHDSVFVNKNFDFNNNNKCKYLWHFTTCLQDNKSDEIRLLKLFNDADLLNFYHDKKWVGCFGCMTSINHDFLEELNNKYNLNVLINNITSRINRCSFERVLACLTQKMIPNDDISYFGEIHKYCKWGMTLTQIAQLKHLPLIKVWTGR